MFNMLVKASPWSEGRDTFWRSRVFEHTSPELRERYTSDQSPDFDSLIKYPVLFLEETSRDRQQFGKVGRITRVVGSGGDELTLEYYFEPGVPLIPQAEIVKIAPLLGISSTRWGPVSFSRTHWAVKDVDLYCLLLTKQFENIRFPNVFRLTPMQSVNRNLLSAMMPFAGFDAVWDAIQRVAKDNGMHAGRADNVWEHHEIIQDIVSLIDNSAIIVCDCTGRNANVFYEIGIAHSLGKEVILITQSANDIPFDLAHLRYIRYLNNGEGVERLIADLNARITTIRSTYSNGA